MDATTAFETLTDLIDANKDKMADYDYMKMMDCMKTMFEKKTETPVTNNREALLTIRNQYLTKKFYEIYTARNRCSNCGDTDHKSSSCRYDATIINFEEADGYGSFSISVFIDKAWDKSTDIPSKSIYDLVSKNIIGWVSQFQCDEDDIHDGYMCKIINGEYHYYNMSTLKFLMVDDAPTSSSMKIGLRNSSVNGKTKYFDK